jgi:hypothetical protein
VRFWAFLGKGSSDRFFLKQKVHVENSPQKIDKHFDVSLSSTSFILSRFRVFLSVGVKKRNKRRCVNKMVPKTCHKKSTKIQNRCFSIFLSRYWAFLGEGSPKIPSKQYRKNKPMEKRVIYPNLNSTSRLQVRRGVERQQRGFCGNTEKPT